MCSPAWLRNEIDAFILAQLGAKGLRPNRPVDKVPLLRREPWARHWLDLARSADSEGFKSDETRPNIWRYCNYVIRSLNADNPYDRFVKEQLAGDELYPDDADALTATAFNRHFPDEGNARNLMYRRQGLLFDITDVVGSTFLGLTFACAKCHDHKSDPILQKDYYRLQAFFTNLRIGDHLVLAKAEIQEEYKRIRLMGREDSGDSAGNRQARRAHQESHVAGWI